MKRLGLGYLSTASAISMIERCGIPWTYCLSPALVAKPADWLSHIGTCAHIPGLFICIDNWVGVLVEDVVGFYFLDLARSYIPPPELEVFLYVGEPPIYIGLVARPISPKALIYSGWFQVWLHRRRRPQRNDP